MTSADHFARAGGVCAIWGQAKAALLLNRCLGGLAHRGAGERGVVLSDGVRLRPGPSAPGKRGLAYVGSSSGQRGRGQPAVGVVRGEELALVLDGAILNAPSLGEELQDQGAVLSSGSEAELFLHLIARSGQSSLVNRVVDALGKARGGWAILLISPSTLIAACDPRGLRPLVLGRMVSGAWALASESCALDRIGAERIRDLLPGEVAVIEGEELASFQPFPPVPTQRCLRELVDIARGDSLSWGEENYERRLRLGARLAADRPAKVDFVVPLPESDRAFATGFAEGLGVPLRDALVLGGAASEDEAPAASRWTPLPSTLRDRRVALVAPSLLDGSSIREIVTAMRRAGVAEVHVRLPAGATRGACHYGVRGAEREGLIAASNELPEVGRFLGADSLSALPMPAVHEAVHGGGDGWCDGCLSGRYPLVHEDLSRRPQLPLFSEA